jgi:hypothetical protein
MKAIRFDVLMKKILSIGLVLVSLAFAAVTSQAAPTVIVDELTATSILNLDVNGTLYDVNFEITTAEALYGPDPYSFTFTTFESSGDAVTAIVDVLNLYNQVNGVLVDSVGDKDSNVLNGVYFVGFEERDAPGCPDDTCSASNNGIYKNTTNVWSAPGTIENVRFGDPKTYAVFTEVSPPNTAAITSVINILLLDE